MVLTNFEFWAADGSSSMPSSSASLEFETSRHLNPFDPRVVPHAPPTNIAHMSSNGYYGFSYINSSHEIELNNNNNNNIDVINNNNLNNTATHNFMANDVNGMNNTTSQQQQPTHVYANFVHRTAEPPPAGTTSRCKKRFYVVSDVDADVNVKCTADDDVVHNRTNASAKRCRFDDDFAAQYCNDFFSLPSTQIATQSCLMDTEDGTTQQQQHQHQQQHQVVVDGVMFENNNNNNICVNNNNNNIEKYEQSILHLQLQHQQQQQQQQQQQSQLLDTHQPPTTLQQQQEQLYHQQQQQQQQQQHHPQQQQHPYHQQQHYQDITINTGNHCQQNPCIYNLQQQQQKHHHHYDHQYHLNRIYCDNWSHSKTSTPNCNDNLRNLKNSKKIQRKKRRNDHDNVDFDAKNNNNNNNDDSKIDDATLFAQIHGGSWHHFNETTCLH